MTSPRIVLLAEQNEELAEMLGESLSSEGYSVVRTGDGLEAIAMAFEEQPDLVLLGYSLPSLDGLRACRFLRSDPLLGGIPVVILSSTRGRSARRRSLRAGASAFLELPVQGAELLSLSERLLEESAASRERSLSNGQSRHPVSPPGREAILEVLEDIFERRALDLEEIWDLAEDLSRAASPREIFRRIASGVLTGLGYERVMVAELEPSSQRLRVELALGPGLEPADSRRVFERDEISGTSMEIAIEEKRQVSGREAVRTGHLAEERLMWGGGIDYLDSPIIVRGRVVGLVRCDRGGPPGAGIASFDRESLRFYLALASVALASSGSASGGQDHAASVLLYPASRSAVLVTDECLRISRLSGHVEELFGRASEEVKGLTPWEAVPILSRDSRPEKLRRAIQEGEDWTEKGVSVNVAGGDRVVLNLRFMPVGSPGRPSGAAVVAEDVTEEHELRESLQRRNEELELVAGIGRELNSDLDVDQILRKLTQVLRQFLPDVYVALLTPLEDELNHQLKGMQVSYTAGYPRPLNPRGLNLRISTGGGKDTPEEASGGSRGQVRPQGVVGMAVARAGVVNIPDVGQEPSYVENVPGIRSELAVPMLVRGRTVGMIDLQSERSGRFDENAVRQVRTLANMAAPALENAMLHEQVQQMALTDELTGLKNLRYFEGRLEEELDRAVRYNYPFSLIVLDIDDFKHYNDSFGHPMGNVIIRSVAGAIRDTLRETDILVRYGGDEFVCILPLTGAREAAEIGARIRSAVEHTEAPHCDEQPGGSITVSSGVATFPSDVGDRELLLQSADERMYEAKRGGKNRVCSSFGLDR